MAALPSPDDLLANYYADPDGERSLACLVESARETIRRRIASRGISGEDLEDLCSTAVARLMSAVRRSRLPDGEPIAHYTAYTQRVADSVFEDHLRATRPNWYRLKRRILYLLDGRAGGRLGRWRLSSDWLGGFLRWHGRPFQCTPSYAILCEQPERFRTEDLASEQPLPVLLCRLFQRVGTPLEVNALTSHVADLQQVCEVRLLPIEARPSTAAEWDCMDPAAQDSGDRSAGELVSRLLDPIGSLPVGQRHALLLSLTGDELLLLGTVGELAGTLEMTPRDLYRLWPELPLPDRVVAERMQLTPKQIANLRKCARERLTRWLKRCPD